MYVFILTLHVLTVMLVIGTLFVQSLTVVFRLRLSDPVQIEGVQWIQHRVHQLIYYPILVVAISSGSYLVLLQEGLTTSGNWLQAKIILLLIIIVFGFLNGRQISNENLRKPQALLVHIGIFMVSAGMIYLAQVKPF
jgi:putative membrane protein